jgi:hypothetical protein
MVGAWYLLLVILGRRDPKSLSLYSACARAVPASNRVVKATVVCIAEWTTALAYLLALTLSGAIAAGGIDFWLLLIASLFSPAVVLAILSAERNVLFLLDRRTRRLNLVADRDKAAIHRACTTRLGGTGRDAVLMLVWTGAALVALVTDSTDIGRRYGLDTSPWLWGATGVAVVYYGLVSGHAFAVIARVLQVLALLHRSVTSRAIRLFNAAIAPALHRAIRALFAAYLAGLFFIPLLAHGALTDQMVGNLGRIALVVSYGVTFAALFTALFMIVDSIALKESRQKQRYYEHQYRRLEHDPGEAASIRKVEVLVNLLTCRQPYQVFEKVLLAQLVSVLVMPVLIGAATEWFLSRGWW